MKQFGSVLYVIFSIAIAMIGYTIHHNLGWAIIDFLFSPVALVYWLVVHDINITIIKETFSFFFK